MASRIPPRPDRREVEHPHTILPLVAALVVVVLVFVGFFLLRTVLGSDAPASTPTPSVTVRAT